jgi:hypothetical protein
MVSQVASRELGAFRARFALNPSARVFAEDASEVESGSGKVGFLAADGATPTGHFKDVARTENALR